MTYHDELTQKSSYELYRTLAGFIRAGGRLEGADHQLFETVGETNLDDGSHHSALVELVERLHDNDLL